MKINYIYLNKKNKSVKIYLKEDPSLALSIYFFGFSFFKRGMIFWGVLFFLITIYNWCTLGLFNQFLLRIISDGITKKVNKQYIKKLLKKGWKFQDPNDLVAIEAIKIWKLNKYIKN